MDKHFILVSTLSRHRFRVQFSPDVRAYFTDETLPDKIKYGLARGDGNKMYQATNGGTEIEQTYQLMFPMVEVAQIMKEAGVGVKSTHEG